METTTATREERNTGETPVLRSPAAEEIPCATLVYLTPIGEFIHSADGKAGTILAVLGLMFTLLARFGSWIDTMFRTGGRVEVLATAVLVGAFVGASLAAVVQAFRTIWPRFPKSASSLAFFRDIARLSPDQYVSHATGLSASQALAERMKYNHTGARIILLKTQQLWWMFRWFETAAACWMAVAILLAWKIISP
jgi:hypothetical protein